MIDDGDTIHPVDVTAGEPTQTWCAECQTSAGVAFDILAVEDDGITVIDNVSGCPTFRTGAFATETQNGGPQPEG